MNFKCLVVFSYLFILNMLTCLCVNAQISIQPYISISISLSEITEDETSDFLENKAISDILKLKKQPLIVRLKDNKLKFEKMRKAGAEKYIKNLKSKLDKENKKIVNGFVEEFKFNQDIYFIYTSEFKKWRSGEPACFLNANQECDETIKLIGDKYYLAEFDFVRQSKYSDTDRRRHGKSDQQGGANLRKEGLILRDSKMDQLEKPLPFFVSKNVWLFDRSPEEMVKILNDQLSSFYNEWIDGEGENEE